MDLIDQPRPAGGAPGALEIVRSFVNTLDLEQGSEALASPVALDDWLTGQGLLAAAGRPVSGPSRPPVPATVSDLRAARELREAIRGVLASHLPGSGQEASGAAAAASLRRAASAVQVALRVGDGGDVYPAPAGDGPAGALAGLLLIAARSAAAGTWNRLKVCSADDCRWAFYDRSPAGNGCWCSMRICGSRAKSRAYRRRAARR